MVLQDIPWEDYEAEIRRRLAEAPSVTIAAATHELEELARESELSFVDPQELATYFLALEEADLASEDFA